jgi:SecD/SecF fusion protein
MLSDFILFAQAVDSTLLKFVGFFAVLILGFGLPFFLGNVIAKRARMAEHGWRIGLILCTIILSGMIVGRAYDPETGEFNIKLGVDLKGGVILIYEVDEDATAAAADVDSGSSGASNGISMGALVEAIARRINPSGTKEIVIRPYGAQQVEIIIPEVDQREVDLIKKSISEAGVLQFRITANSRDHAHIIDLARQAAQDPNKKRGRYVRDETGEQVGLWARVGRVQEEGRSGTFKVSVAQNTIRDSATGDIIEVEPAHFGDDTTAFTQYIASRGINEIDVLMETDDPYNVTGNHLGAVSRGNDEQLRPCILFNLKAADGGVKRFADLTTVYGPEGNFQRQLGIVLDNTLLSAPNIQEPITQGRGRITGQFTKEEVDFIVNILEAGSLPVILNPIPISENLINPTLGKETIQQGKTAMAISLAIVLVFILIYYRFSGVVACLALLLNLLFILAMMISIKAAFTLPGLAGLVLTVGMSVDANVLIFERIREELARGAALRMAIRNGFARATTTIVDANVTTLITAFVLYGIGTDQIRGFAVTLILGILMSMFTAIFCSRVVFDVAERTRWLKKLNMMHALGATQIDFVGKRKLAAAFSIVVIVVGLAGIAGRGAGIFDIDFRGGTSVQLRLKSSMDTELVRERLATQFASSGVQFTVTAMNNTAGATTNDTFKVDSDVAEVADLESAIHDAFAGANGQSELATYSLEYGSLRTVAIVAPSASTPEPTAEEKASPSETEPPTTTDAVPAETPEAETPKEESVEKKPEATPATSEPKASDDAEKSSFITPGDGTYFVQATTPEASDTATPETATPEAASEDDTTAEEDAPSASSQTNVAITFGYPINAPTLTGEIESAAKELSLPISQFQLNTDGWDGTSSKPYASWNLEISADEAQTTQLLNHLQGKFADTPVWASSSKIGGQVAGDMQQKAIAAFVACLFGIVLYIWIRFQKVIFGLAAVVALVHDVLVTLGAIALSAWLADALGFLLIEEFKISLPIVAALLTIIGYSLNDTIVVFDRIREVRGKSPDLTGDMINTSINQTLSRTMLTSLTTLLVVVILYAIGGSGIHGFAFSLVIGVIVGTYSSIFVASPVLLWMTSANQKKAANKAKKVSGKASASA